MQIKYNFFLHILMLGFFNGSYISLDEITVPITNFSINRGYGAYEFFEIINRRPFFLDRHIARLKNSLKLLRLENKHTDNLVEISQQLIEKNNFDKGFIKILVLPKNAKNPERMDSNLYVFPVKYWTFTNENYRQGMNLILQEYQRFLPEAKSTNYLPGQYLQYEIDNSLSVDVLFHCNKVVLETSRGNIFMIKDNQLLTPKQNILHGITRSLIMEIAQQQNIPFFEKNICLNDLYAADEVFISSTSKQVMPIVKIHEQVINDGTPGRYSKMLLSELIKLKELH